MHESRSGVNVLSYLMSISGWWWWVRFSGSWPRTLKGCFKISLSHRPLRRAQAAFELERAQFRAQFDELSRELRELRERERRAGGSSRYGEGSRRG